MSASVDIVDLSGPVIVGLSSTGRVINQCTKIINWLVLEVRQALGLGTRTPERIYRNALAVTDCHLAFARPVVLR